MSAPLRSVSALLVLASFATACTGPGVPSNAPDVAGARAEAEASTEYVEGRATVDGIGKFYMGREISQVMGHLGAGWLERDTREQRGEGAAAGQVGPAAPGAGGGYAVTTREAR